MEAVKMVASVAGEEVFVGECHPARARVLVKRQFASWKDGKVLLHILNVHDQVLSTNPEAIRGPLDDGNVSKQELERRMAWFRSFMEKVTHVVASHFIELPSKEEAEAWRERVKGEVKSWKEGLPLNESPEAEAEFEAECVALGTMWEADGESMVSHHTGIQHELRELSSMWEDGEVTVTVPGAPEVVVLNLDILREHGVTLSGAARTAPSREAYEAVRARDKEALAAERALLEDEGATGQEVATFDQLRCMSVQGWSRTLR